MSPADPVWVLSVPKPSAGAVRTGVQSCLDTTARLEPDVQAWACLDAQAALQRAGELDTLGASAESMPLYGLCVGLKDIIDTAGMPTENGTVLHAGRRPKADAEVVRRLHAAGAVVVGKTVTTELATYAPGKTRNPHDLQRTPGGSSSGSAAAVACGMVPLALGSQTNGSTVRPAAFCGVVGLKPERDALPRQGVLVQSPSFDTVGLFARTVGDVACLFNALADLPQRTSTVQTHGLEGGAGDPTPVAGASRVRVAWWPTPFWSRVDSEAQGAYLRAVQFLALPLADGAEAQVLDGAADEIVTLHRLIMEAEIARSFAAEFDRDRSALSASLQGQITRGRETDAGALAHAWSRLLEIRREVDRVWSQDVVLAMPSALGVAPVGLHSTGDPIMCTLGTALDLPAINVPGLKGPHGMPLGMQLMGRRGGLSSLLHAAQWLQTTLGSHSS